MDDDHTWVVSANAKEITADTELSKLYNWLPYDHGTPPKLLSVKFRNKQEAQHLYNALTAKQLVAVKNWIN